MLPLSSNDTCVRLPRSARSRNAVTWAKLLARVWRDAGGWRFDGDLLRPGAPVDAAEGAVLLECAGSVGGTGHNRAGTLYILWQLDGGEWRELARATAVYSDWTLDLGPIAARALAPPGPVLVDPEGAARRVAAALERELEPLNGTARRVVLLRIYDEVAARVAA